MRGFQCPKCDNTEYETGQFRAVGGTLSKIFDVQSQRFTTVTCTRCRYFKADKNKLEDIFDLFTS